MKKSRKPAPMAAKPTPSTLNLPLLWNALNSMLLAAILVRLHAIEARLENLEQEFYKIQEALGLVLSQVSEAMMSYYIQFRGAIESILSLFGGTSS